MANPRDRATASRIFACIVRLHRESGVGTVLHLKNLDYSGGGVTDGIAAATRISVRHVYCGLRDFLVPR